MSADPVPGTAANAEIPAMAEAAEESPFASIAPSPDLPSDLPGGTTEKTGAAAEPGRLDLVLEVPVHLSVELGRAQIPIRDVVNLARGSVVDLDRSPGEALDVLVNGVLIGRGEIVVINEERLGLRFIEVVSQAERVKRLG
ncbi:MAG TPA: flagellar motor switch protein FliN [Stellaceae bacterium]|nr:flagellar motor switch protein FliN [Stellaceae bacterium]